MASMQKATNKRSTEKVDNFKKELSIQLQHLRTVLKEIVAIYTSNLERDLVSLSSKLSEQKLHHDGNKSIKASHLKQMLKMTKEISLKPEKGRRKDLKRIEDVVEKMLLVAFPKEIGRRS